MITYFLIKSKGKEFVIFMYISILYLVISINIFGWLSGIGTYLLLFIIWSIFAKFKVVSDNRFDIFFGPPGCGKSTIAVLESLDYLKKEIQVNTYNLSIPSCNLLQSKSELVLSNPKLRNSLLIIDEAGVDFDNRNFKDNFTKENVKFFKYHRHINCDIIVLSQSWNDIDLKLRNLATRIFKVKKSIIPFFIKTKMISKDSDIDELTHQITDINSYVLFSSCYYWMPKSWKFFDSFCE